MGIKNISDKIRQCIVLGRDCGGDNKLKIWDVN